MHPVGARLRLSVGCTLEHTSSISLSLVVLLQVGHSHFSPIVISFQKSVVATSDTILAVMTTCFTPAARPASRMRVVPETAP